MSKRKKKLASDIFLLVISIIYLFFTFMSSTNEGNPPIDIIVNRVDVNINIDALA